MEAEHALIAAMPVCANRIARVAGANTTVSSLRTDLKVCFGRVEGRPGSPDWALRGRSSLLDGTGRGCPHFGRPRPWVPRLDRGKRAGR